MFFVTCEDVEVFPVLCKQIPIIAVDLAHPPHPLNQLTLPLAETEPPRRLPNSGNPLLMRRGGMRRSLPFDFCSFRELTLLYAIPPQLSVYSALIVYPTLLTWFFRQALVPFLLPFFLRFPARLVPSLCYVRPRSISVLKAFTICPDRLLRSISPPIPAKEIIGCCTDRSDTLYSSEIPPVHLAQ